MRAFAARLRRECSGSTVVEFALLAPVLIGSLLGVLHVGTGLQNYNAMRAVSADVARYAVIEYARGTNPDNAALGTWGTNRATSAAYKLRRDAVNNTQIVVVTDATSPIAGVAKKDIVVTVRMPTLFDEMGLRGFRMTYSRPLFLPT